MVATTSLSLCLSIHPTDLSVNIGGMPHLAKNERDMGHPSFVRQPEVKSAAWLKPTQIFVTHGNVPSVIGAHARDPHIGIYIDDLAQNAAGHPNPRPFHNRTLRHSIRRRISGVK